MVSNIVLLIHIIVMIIDEIQILLLSENLHVKRTRSVLFRYFKKYIYFRRIGLKNVFIFLKFKYLKAVEAFFNNPFILLPLFVTKCLMYAILVFLHQENDFQMIIAGS